MGKYHNDQPIQGSDNDLLNRDKFAIHLANILLLNHDDDCLTVSLEGKWGDGKTSVINLIKEELSKKVAPPLVVEYNPWLSGKPEALIQDFLLQLSTKLSINNNAKDALKIAEELIAYSSLFSVAKLIPGAEPWASIIEKVFTKFGSTTKKIAKIKELDVLGKKEKVKEALTKIEIPIIVIIDDIDRLTPEEIFQVLRLVKAVADFPRVAFLLAFDADYLVPVLNKNNIVDANEYINKVIQLRAPLPVISNRGMDALADTELKRLSNNNLTAKFREDSERLSFIWHKFFKNLIKNPRDLKRFFNHLRLVVGLVEGQVCFADLFALSLIATKANLIYEHIKKTPEAYIGQGFAMFAFGERDPKQVVKLFNKERNNKFEGSKLNVNERRLIESLIIFLFPLVDFDEDLNDFFSNVDLDVEGRVSIFQRLYTALHYTTPIGYISDQEILKFISSKSDRKIFLENVIESDANIRFLDMMRNYAPECKDHSEILNCIYDAYLFSPEVLRGSHEYRGCDLYFKIKNLTWEVVCKSSNTRQLIEHLVIRSKNAPIAAYVLRKIKKQVQNDHDENKWGTEAERMLIDVSFQKAAIEALTKELFVGAYLASDILKGLMFSSQEKANECLAGILKGKNGALKVAEIIAYSGSDSTNGYYVFIEEKNFSDAFDFKELQQKSSNVQLEKQPIYIQAVIKSILDGKKYCLRDAELGEIF